MECKPLISNASAFLQFTHSMYESKKAPRIEKQTLTRHEPAKI